MKYLHELDVLRILWQIAVMAALSCLAGIATLPRVKPADLQTPTASPMPLVIISLDEMLKATDSGNAVLVDARSRSDYQQGHIHGAISLPVTDFDRGLSQNIELFTQAKPVIIYCTGKNCDLSDLLARKLMSIGMDKVSIFKVGWNAWKTAGLPIER